MDLIENLIDEEHLFRNSNEFQNIKHKSDVLYDFMRSGIISLEDHERIQSCECQGFGFLLSSIFLRIIVENKASLTKILSILETHGNHKLSDVIRVAFNHNVQPKHHHQITSKESFESITWKISKCGNPYTITSLTIDNIHMETNAVGPKIQTPNLQHLTIHFTCAEIGSLHDQHEVIFYSFRSKLLDPFCQTRDIETLLPVDKSILKLNTVFITLNSLILIQSSENSLIMSCLDNSLAQQCLNAFGSGKHTIAIHSCGHKAITLRRNDLNKLKVFACIFSTIKNLDALQLCSLQKFSCTSNCGSVSFLSNSNSLEHLTLRTTDDSISSLCFPKVRYILTKLSQQNISALESVFPAADHLFIEENSGVGVNVFERMTSLKKNLGCKELIWRKTPGVLWSQEDRQLLNQVGIDKPKSVVCVFDPKLKVGMPNWVTFGEYTPLNTNAYVKYSLLDLFFHL